MNKNEISIGKKVRYYPIRGASEFRETQILSQVWELCGVMCCKIEGTRGGVSIENLKIIKERKENE